MNEFFPDEPMELVATPVPGVDPGYMAECLVEEYLLMGWSERALMRLFTLPVYGATHRIYRERGDAYVRDLIARVGQRWSNQRSASGDLHA